MSKNRGIFCVSVCKTGSGLILMPSVMGRL